MGLFHRNENDANFAGGSRNVLESIQSAMDTETLMYVDNRVDFNTNSVITVRPNELAIFIKNGELYGILPSGRHELKNENYPILSRLRNMLAGGMSTFTCQIIWVRTNEQNVSWGTASPIEIQDYFLGGGQIGVPTILRGAGEFRVRFDINENEDASIQAFMRLMGDKSAYSVNDLSMLLQAQMSSEISDVIGKALENRSKRESINAISSQMKDFAKEITPYFSELFKDYGFELVNFSFHHLSIDNDTPERKKYMDRLIGAAHAGSYNAAVAQELLGNLSVNEGAGGVASAGAGMGMGMAAGGAFASMAASAFSQPQPQMPQQPMGFGSGNRFGVDPTQTPNPAQPDPMETLSKMKKMLDAGLITQEMYDAKLAEVMSRM